MAKVKNDFKKIAGEKVQAQKNTHAEIGNELMDSMPNNSHRVLDLSIAKIIDNPYQPRQYFREDSIRELAESIKEHGLLNPILVRQDGEDYYLVGGERRLRACEIIGKDTIRAIVINADPEIASLIDNVQREDLHPMERAFAVGKLYKKNGESAKKVAEMISTSENTVQRLLKLCELQERITSLNEGDNAHRLVNNRIPLREFYELMRIEDDDTLNTKYEQLEKKYGNEPKADPIKKRVLKTQDTLDKALTYTQKILQEISTKSINKDDKRLQQLLAKLDDLTAKIRAIQNDDSVSN